MHAASQGTCDQKVLIGGPVPDHDTIPLQIAFLPCNKMAGTLTSSTMFFSLWASLETLPQGLITSSLTMKPTQLPPATSVTSSHRNGQHTGKGNPKPDTEFIQTSYQSSQSFNYYRYRAQDTQLSSSDSIQQSPGPYSALLSVTQEALPLIGKHQNKALLLCVARKSHASSLQLCIKGPILACLVQTHVVVHRRVRHASSQPEVMAHSHLLYAYGA